MNTLYLYIALFMHRVQSTLTRFTSQFKTQPEIYMRQKKHDFYGYLGEGSVKTDMLICDDESTETESHIFQGFKQL